jgi:hypothetical protein
LCLNDRCNLLNICTVSLLSVRNSLDMQRLTG